MNGNNKTLQNGLIASIDWLSFTITSLGSLDEVVQLMGYSLRDFDTMPHGGKGYRSMIRLNGYSVTVLHDGLEGMGIHVDISGSAIPEVLRSFKETLRVDTPFGDGYEIDFSSTYLCELLKKIRTYGHITRLDLAIDDIGGLYFSIDDIVGIWKTGCMISKFRQIQNLEVSEISGEKTGHTLYLGTRKSEMFLRIYDKQLEQNKKLANTDTPPVCFPWVRWELECKDGRANAIADLILSGLCLGDVCIGILGNYVRMIELDNNNRSRCSVNTLWADFLDGIRGLKLYIPDHEKSIDEKKEWLNKQVMPTIAAIVMSDGGSFEFITDNLQSGFMRMKKPLLDLVRKENPSFGF